MTERNLYQFIFKHPPRSQQVRGRPKEAVWVTMARRQQSDQQNEQQPSAATRHPTNGIFYPQRNSETPSPPSWGRLVISWFLYCCIRLASFLFSCVKGFVVRSFRKMVLQPADGEVEAHGVLKFHFFGPPPSELMNPIDESIGDDIDDEYLKDW